MPEASGSDLTDEDHSIFENKTGLGEDMKFLASMPELCDVTFLVGDTREPICAVKAVLAARSRVFQKMFYQAPSPQSKKEPPPRENKFRVFLKRSSEPLLNLQNAAQQRSVFAQQLAPIQEPNQHHTVIIEEFEPDVFRQLIEYIHTGCVTLQPRTLLGLMNAADYYGLDQLRKACSGFVQCCITVDTVCALLASAERYFQYKCTKPLVQKVLEFVDEHGNEVLNLGSFTLLPQHVVRLILVREELRADEFTKFQAALMWSKKYCDGNEDQKLKKVIGNFLEYIQFHKIPTNVLMKEVHPLGLVPSGIILHALAYQADPTCVDPGKLSPHRVKQHDRSLSVQSSLQDPGSNTSLSSTGSDEGSDEKQHSGKYGIAEQESRDEHRWPKQRDEEEDLQRLIEQRSQFQQMRQEEEVQREQEEQQSRRQEEELRKQEMQEEFDKLRKKKKEEEEETRNERESKKLDEESKRKDGEEFRRKQQENLRRFEEILQMQREQEKRELEMLQQEQQKAAAKKQSERWSRSQEKDEVKTTKRKDELLKVQSENQVERFDTDRMELQEIERQDKEESTGETMQGSSQRLQSQEQLNEEQEFWKRLRDEEQKRIREERKMKLQLEELKTRWTMQQELLLQRQEEMLQRQIQESRYEEQFEGQQFHQLQLQIEGLRPEPEGRSDELQTVEPRKSRKRKRDRVEIRIKESESSSQERELEEQQPTASEDGVSGLYIRIVVKREGRANLVWLLKTHKF